MSDSRIRYAYGGTTATVIGDFAVKWVYAPTNVAFHITEYVAVDETTPPAESAPAKVQIPPTGKLLGWDASGILRVSNSTPPPEAAAVLFPCSTCHATVDSDCCFCPNCGARLKSE